MEPIPGNRAVMTGEDKKMTKKGEKARVDIKDPIAIFSIDDITGILTAKEIKQLILLVILTRKKGKKLVSV